MSDERRKFKRIKIDNLSRINDTNASVVNVSKDGMLLTTSNDGSPGKQVEIQLKINGKWVAMQANVMWIIDNPAKKSISMGVFISNAPYEYNEFVDNLYLEANAN